MNRNLALVTLVLCSLGAMTLRSYSAPKTLNVDGSVATETVVGTRSGIPPEFGNLVSVDNGYLYFTDEAGTIRRVALGREGTMEGPVLVIPRK